MRMPEGDGPVETVSAGDFDLTAGRCGGAARYGASVVRFEDALERYRNRRLTAEEEALGLLRVSVLHASLCSRVVDRDMGTRAIGEVGGHDVCRFGRVF